MEYELIHEICNPCRGNQMRDVFFREITCDDPESYVRAFLGGRIMELSCEAKADGQMVIRAVSDSLVHRFDFCPL